MATPNPPARYADGRAHPIVQVGDPVLATPCAPVTTFDEELQTLIADMFASMYAADGVGLAANQIGISRSVFVYDCPDDTDVHAVGVVCNPVLQDLPADARHLDEDAEGCLSVRGQFSDLARPDAAVVEGQDGDGQPITVTGTGLLARCLQHETDHLNGMLFIDRLTAKARKKVLAGWRETVLQADAS
jgi:peptide deformylase